MPESIKGWLLLMGAVMIGLLIFATLYQYRIDRNAQGWTKTRGRIRSSRVVARKVRKSGERGSEMRNFAEISYEYLVPGEEKPRRSSRVHLGHDPGNVDVGETVARYQAGADVDVFFNPAKPSEAALERDAPEGVYQTLVIFILCCIGAWLAFAFGTDGLVDAVTERIPKPGNMWAVGLFGGAGAFLGLIALTLRHELHATRAWKVTWGRIESAEVESFMARSASRLPRWTRLYTPLIAYSYSVGGQRYTGSRIRLGGMAFLSRDFWARRQASAYKVGAPVEVYYDPQNPTSAVLERRSVGLGWLWGVVVALFVLAARAAGFI